MAHHYEHHWAIKHFPKFAYGMFLLIVTPIAIMINFDGVMAREPFAVVFTAINSFGLIAGTMLVIDAIEYTVEKVED